MILIIDNITILVINKTLARCKRFEVYVRGIPRMKTNNVAELLSHYFGKDKLCAKVNNDIHVTIQNPHYYLYQFCINETYETNNIDHFLRNISQCIK